MLLHACCANPHILLLCRSIHTLATISTVFPFPLVFPFPTFSPTPHYSRGMCFFFWAGGGTCATLHACCANPHVLLLCRSIHALATISTVFPFLLVFPLPTLSPTPHYSRGFFCFFWAGRGGGTCATLFPELPFPHFPTSFFPQPNPSFS